MIIKSLLIRTPWRKNSFVTTSSDLVFLSGSKRALDSTEMDQKFFKNFQKFSNLFIQWYYNRHKHLPSWNPVSCMMLERFHVDYFDLQCNQAILVLCFVQINPRYSMASLHDFHQDFQCIYSKNNSKISIHN